MDGNIHATHIPKGDYMCHHTEELQQYTEVGKMSSRRGMFVVKIRDIFHNYQNDTLFHKYVIHKRKVYHIFYRIAIELQNKAEAFFQFCNCRTEYFGQGKEDMHFHDKLHCTCVSHTSANSHKQIHMTKTYYYIFELEDFLFHRNI